MGIIGWLLLGAFLVCCLYTLRFILAIPIALLLKLLGQGDAMAKGQVVVGSVSTFIWVFLTGAALIWTWPMYSGAFGVIFENLWYLITLLPKLLWAALGCYAHLSC